jgi:hypothetical protein
VVEVCGVCDDELIMHSVEVDAERELFEPHMPYPATVSGHPHVLVHAHTE